jgi:hypothetical protein
VRGCERPTLVGTIGAWLFIAMGLVIVTTATVFPQDAWASPPTFPGEMHKILIGLVGLPSILSMLLLGIGFSRAGVSRGFGTYTFLTAAVVLLLAVFYAAKMGSPIMGLAERVTILAGFLWTFILALSMSSR